MKAKTKIRVAPRKTPAMEPTHKDTDKKEPISKPAGENKGPGNTARPRKNPFLGRYNRKGVAREDLFSNYYKGIGLERTRNNVLRDLERHKKPRALLIPKAPMVRLIEETLRKSIGKMDVRLESAAIEVLHEAVEARIVREFEFTNLAAIHAKRVTIQQKDMKLIQQLRSIMTGDQTNVHNNFTAPLANEPVITEKEAEKNAEAEAESEAEMGGDEQAHRGEQSDEYEQ